MCSIISNYFVVKFLLYSIVKINREIRIIAINGYNYALSVNIFQHVLESFAVLNVSMQAHDQDRKANCIRELGI